MARERMSAAMEARRKREEANTKDLEKFYFHGGKVDAAAAKRDAAIAAAHETYRKAESAALDAQGAALRSIRDRNTPQGELTEMTGLSAGELQKLLKRSAPTARPATPAEPAPRPKRETGSGDAGDSNVTPLAGRTGDVPGSGSEVAPAVDTAAPGAPEALGAGSSPAPAP